MKWLILGVIVFIGLFILLFTIAMNPMENELVNEAIIAANSTMGNATVANNFTGYSQTVRWIPIVAILTVVGCIGIAAYTQIKKKD